MAKMGAFCAFKTNLILEKNNMWNDLSQPNYIIFFKKNGQIKHYLKP